MKHKGEVSPLFGDDSDSLFFCRDESPLFFRVEIQNSMRFLVVKDVIFAPPDYITPFPSKDGICISSPTSV